MFLLPFRMTSSSIFLSESTPRMFLNLLFESQQNKYVGVTHFDDPVGKLGYVSEVTFWERDSSRYYRYRLQLTQDEVLKVYQSHCDNSHGWNYGDDIEIMTVDMKNEKWKHHSLSSFVRYFWNDFNGKKFISRVKLS